MIQENKLIQERESFSILPGEDTYFYDFKTEYTVIPTVELNNELKEVIINITITRVTFIYPDTEGITDRVFTVSSLSKESFLS